MLFRTVLSHFLIYHFETVPNSKKLQTTTEVWLLKAFKLQIALKTEQKKFQENIVEKGEIAHLQQFQLFPYYFPKAFFLQCVKMSIYGG